MEDKICQYCEQPINDKHFSFMWFPDISEFKPVHNYHLRIKKGAKYEPV